MHNSNTFLGIAVFLDRYRKRYQHTHYKKLRINYGKYRLCILTVLYIIMFTILFASLYIYIVMCVLLKTCNNTHLSCECSMFGICSMYVTKYKTSNNHICQVWFYKYKKNIVIKDSKHFTRKCIPYIIILHWKVCEF